MLLALCKWYRWMPQARGTWPKSKRRNWKPEVSENVPSLSISHLATSTRWRTQTCRARLLSSTVRRDNPPSAHLENIWEVQCTLLRVSLDVLQQPNTMWLVHPINLGAFLRDAWWFLKVIKLVYDTSLVINKNKMGSGPVGVWGAVVCLVLLFSISHLPLLPATVSEWNISAPGHTVCSTIAQKQESKEHWVQLGRRLSW